MAESATSESAYFHTLTARPFFIPQSRDPRLLKITHHLPELLPEIRLRIYELAFRGNRVAVTAGSGCYCASDTTGPYRADHRWLLTGVSGRLRQDVQRAFIELAMWEVHCVPAFDLFLKRMTILNALSHIRHIRVNVFDTSHEPWHLPLDTFPKLKTVTFAPWQKGWTIDVPYTEDSNAMSDTGVMEKVNEVLKHKAGYGYVGDLVKGRRSFRVYFVFPIRFLLPPEKDKEGVQRRLPKWQLKVWRADLDANTVDREWREVHLVQEATLD